MSMSEGPWKEGSHYGALKKEVTNAAGRVVATVFVKHYYNGSPVVWPEGEANFQAIVTLPKLVEALKELTDSCINLPDPEEGEDAFVAYEKRLEKAKLQARAVLADCGAEMED